MTMDANYLETPGPWLPVKEYRTIVWYDGPVLFETEVEGKPVLAFTISDESWQEHVVSFLGFNVSDELPVIRDMKADRISISAAMLEPSAEIYEFARHEGELIGRRVQRQLTDDILPDESVFYSEFISTEF